jgi:hypothetical protein
LATKLPSDRIEPEPKGESGADVLQRGLSTSGQQCGTLLWESKLTKSWSDSWHGKLPNHQGVARADFAVLVSRALPNEIESFDLVDGIWVVETRFAIPLAMALGQSLIEVATARQINAGQSRKMGMVYEYLTGPRLRAERYGMLRDIICTYQFVSSPLVQNLPGTLVSYVVARVIKFTTWAGSSGASG